MGQRSISMAGRPMRGIGGATVWGRCRQYDVGLGSAYRLLGGGGKAEVSHIGGRKGLARTPREARGGGGPSGRSVCPEGPGNGLKRGRKLRNSRKTRKMVKKSGDLAGKREISGPKTPSGPFFSPRAPSSPRGFGHCRRFLASFASFARTKKWP